MQGKRLINDRLISPSTIIHRADIAAILNQPSRDRWKPLCRDGKETFVKKQGHDASLWKHLFNVFYRSFQREQGLYQQVEGYPWIPGFHFRHT